MPLRLEQLRRLVHGHALRVHLDADDEAHVAEQRILQLREAVLRLVGVEALVEHHLLVVVRPALGVRAAPNTLRTSDGKLFA